jgi:diguanylate cyclase (GGDEF)-like protein
MDFRPLDMPSIDTRGLWSTMHCDNERTGGHTLTADPFPVPAAVTSRFVLDEVLASVAHHTAEVLDLWECDIYEYRATENVTVGQVMWAREPHPADAQWVGATEGLELQPSFRRVLTERHTIANHIDDPDLPQADRTRMEFWGHKSCLLVPLVFKDEVIGCLELIEKRRPRRFTAGEERLAATLAALAAIAIQNARLYDNVEQLAITDGLTGLYNHRHFFERLTQEVARAKRYDLPLSLLMIDIDDFKGYNDAFGHLSGDNLLRALAAVLLAQTRQHIDFIARYGGEEFAIILPSTGPEGGLRAGERLRDAISDGDMGHEIAVPAAAPEAPLAEPEGSPGAARIVGERIRHTVETETFGSVEAPPVITVSIGVAGLHAGIDTVDGLVEDADRALYRIKQLGKNQVGVAPPPARPADS